MDFRKKLDESLLDRASPFYLFENAVRGKSVALVGNATSLLSEGKADEIDKHECVIRMNGGNPKVVGEHLVGKRTNIWATSRHWESLRGMTKIDNIDLLVSMKLTPLGLRDYLWTLHDIDQVGAPVIRWPKELKEQCDAFCKCDAGVGLQLLWWLKRVALPAYVNVYGMDGWKTPTHWHGRMQTWNHNPAQERAMIKELCSK